MKIAVCFFGYPRFPKTGKVLNEKFYEGIEIDYFAHFWENENTQEIQTLYKFKKILIEKQIDFSNEFDFEVNMTNNDRGIHNSVSPLYSVMQLGNLLENENDYDYVVITRTDVACLNIQLKDFLKDNNIFYSSYVPGNVWIIDGNDDHIDFKFLCSSKENILFLTSLYKFLKKYLKDDKIQFCHHRLLAHHLKKQINIFSLIYSENEINHGWSGINDGWFYIRDNNLSRS